MKPIIAIKKSELSAKDKEKLTKGGYVVIECDNPESIKVIQPLSTTNGEVILKAALDAMAKGGGEYQYRENFCKGLAKRILDSEINH